MACASHIQLLIIQTQPKCHLNLFPTSRVCLAGPLWTFTQSELSSRENAMKPSITDLYVSTLTLRITVNNAYELALPLHQHGYLGIFCTLLILTTQGEFNAIFTKKTNSSLRRLVYSNAGVFSFCFHQQGNPGLGYLVLSISSKQSPQAQNCLQVTFRALNQRTTFRSLKFRDCKRLEIPTNFPHCGGSLRA